MPKGIKVVGWIMVGTLSIVALVSGIDRREVSYFIAFGIPILLVCGWIIALIATKSPIQDKAPADRKPGRRLARGLGITMIVMGALTFYSIAGIFSLFIGIGLVRLKRQSHVNATILMWVELIASAVALVAGMGLLNNAQVPTVSEQIATDTIGPLVVAGIIGLVISLPLLILLKRPSVREVYWQSPA